MSYSIELKDLLRSDIFSVERELVLNNVARNAAERLIGDLEKERRELNQTRLLDYRHSGIYAAHLAGVTSEEIAFYGDYSLEYVERCIQYKKAQQYSRRTGNAVMFPWPEDY